MATSKATSTKQQNGAKAAPDTDNGNGNGTIEEIGRAAKQTARGTAKTVSRSVSQAADETVQSARSLADDYANRGKSQTEDAIRSIGRALNAGCDSLESDGYPGAAGYVRAAANGLSQAADQVDGFDTRSLTGRAEQFVRDKPLITMGGLALVGFALASIVKAPPRR